MARIAVYARVSTDKDSQLNSLENQKVMFLEKIENDGDELYHVFYDEGLTGTKLNNRDGFNDMLTAAGIDVETTTYEKVLPNGNLDKRVRRKVTNYFESDREPLFDILYVKNTSRLSRCHLIIDVVSLMRKKGVHIYFYEQGILTKDMSQDMMYQLWNLFDSNVSRDYSLKVFTGLERSAKNNVIHTNTTIYGYKYDKNDNSLHQIPQEAKTVKLIFELYKDGKGTRQIIKYLDEHGYNTRQNKSFGKTTINRILANEKYFGGNPEMKYTSGRVFAKESYPKVKSEYNVQLNPRIEAIISEELFYECKSLRESKLGASRGIYSGVSKYAKKIRCTNCHSIFISDKDRGREFFRCYGKKEKGVSFCNARNVTKSALDDKILSDMKDNKLQKAFHQAIELLQSQLENLSIIYGADNSALINKCKNELLELSEENKTAFREYSKGKLIEDIYDSILQENNKRIEHLKSEIERLEEPERQLSSRKDLLTIRLNKLKKRLASPFTEKDYLKFVSLYVSGDKIYSKYILPELQTELEENAKVSKEMFDTLDTPKLWGHRETFLQREAAHGLSTESAYELDNSALLSQI